MFRRPALYHPYKPSGPLSAAGIRLGNYIPKRCFNLFQGPDFTNARSPDPSPLSSPVRDARYSDDDAPPTIRLADFLGADGLGSPQRPTTPSPDRRQNAKPNVVPAKAPLQDPLRRRKGKGPKHLTFINVADRRSGDLPPRRRSRQLKEKRDAARKRRVDVHERRAAQARDGVRHLVKEAEELMRPECMTNEDRIFLRQLANLELDDKLKQDLERCRERIARAAGETEERRKAHRARDREARKLRREQQDQEAEEEQRRVVEEFVRRNEEKMVEEGMCGDEQRQRAHEAAERKVREEQERLFREELARKTKEQEECCKREEESRLREERDRRLREERERQQWEEWRRRLEEELKRARQLEKERQQREELERKLREEVERLRRAAHERILREERERQAREEQERQAREEREREARLRAEQAHRAAEEDRIQRHFTLYEAKWNELRTSDSIPLIDVREMPWPVFGVISSADQITYHGVRAFLFHPQRPGVEGKTARDRVKWEVLRFHPDKFNTRVVPNIQPSQQALAREIAGAVARILTTILTEEAGHL